MRELFADSMKTSELVVLLSVLNSFWASPWFYPFYEHQTQFSPQFRPQRCPLWYMCVSVSGCVCVCREREPEDLDHVPPLWRSLVPQMACRFGGESTGPPLFNAGALWRPAPFHLPVSSGCSTTNQGWWKRGEKHKRDRRKWWPEGRGRDGAGIRQFVATGQLSC